MSERRDRLTVWFDGGCRPSPGPMETAVVLRGKTHIRTELGEGDNNLAEWLALLHAVDLAAAVGADDVLFVGDSVMVVEQALGRQRCRDERLRMCRDAFLAATAGIGRLHLKSVRRSKNLAGIALERARQRWTPA